MNVKCFSSCHRRSEEMFCVESLEMLCMKSGTFALFLERRKVCSFLLLSHMRSVFLLEKKEFYSQFVSSVLARCLCDTV